MTAKRKKDQLAAAVAPPEVAEDDRIVLIDAYKTGLILAWKRDAERGYCLTLADRADAYVSVDQLTKYVEALKAR
jgi:hypothetical protein